MLITPCMQGYITEADFAQAEEVFPGITALYESLEEKPSNFLELVWLYNDIYGERGPRPTAIGGEIMQAGA